jgi:low temperature requirement protein LtrA
VSEASARRDLERAESISWLELFFDLVVVAAVAVLVEGLHEDLTWHSVGLTAIVYVAIWSTWSLTVLYANVAAGQTRFRVVTESMFLIAIMTAAAPMHEDQRANLFAGAFLVARGLLSRSSMSTGRVLASWPLLQLGSVSAPWIVSLFVDPPAKYWLWAAALALDLVLTAVRSGDVDAVAMERLQERMDQHTRRGPRIELQQVDVDRDHLEERLGLFLIIVLGETVVQVVHAAATTVPWTRDFLSVAIASFLLLLGLWRHAFVHGFTGAPDTSLADLPPRVGLPMHLVATSGLVALAAGIAELLHEPGEEPSYAVAWLVAGGLATYFGVGLVASIAGRAPLRWTVGWAGATTVWAVALGFVAPHVPAAHVGWLAAVPAGWLAFSGWAVRDSYK